MELKNRLRQLTERRFFVLEPAHSTGSGQICLVEGWFDFFQKQRMSRVVAKGLS